jgi:hypothetical protein
MCHDTRQSSGEFMSVPDTSRGPGALPLAGFRESLKPGEM